MVGSLDEGKSRIASLPARLHDELERIRPSVNYNLHLYPCEVTLRDGTVVPRVIVAEAGSWIQQVGAWPWELVHPSIDIVEVDSLRQTNRRLPATLATRAYGFGESSMGGMRFQVQFADGSTADYLTGNVVDFLQEPPNVGFAEAMGVEPVRGALSGSEYGPADFVWCLYWGEGSA